MKKLKQLSAIIILLHLFSCNNATSASGNPALPAAASKAATTDADASFSCKIDGKDFSGQGTDKYGNAAFLTTPGILTFTLVPIVAGQKGVPAQFAFTVADKGTTTIHGTDNPNYSAHFSPENTLDDEYQSKELTVTITSSGTSGVTGTFSGTLSEPKTDRAVPVTDGKFEIPYSPYGKK